MIYNVCAHLTCQRAFRIGSRSAHIYSDMIREIAQSWLMIYIYIYSINECGGNLELEYLRVACVI